MTPTFVCNHCRCRMPANPRLKDQQYCNKKECQRAHKRKWQQARMASDPDYRDNQRDAYNAWRERNPDYWRNRRAKKRESLSSPKLVSQVESAGPVKMDTLNSNSVDFSGEYMLVPIFAPGVKMDALRVKITAIPVG